MERTHYRLEFFLNSKPAYRRRLELLDKMEALKKLVKQKGHTGDRGLSNMTCYAPYSNYAVCTLSAGGETEWLPKMIDELGREDERLGNIKIGRVSIEPLHPSAKAKKTEELWVKEASEHEKEKVKETREEFVTIEKATEMRAERLKEKPRTERTQMPIDETISKKLGKGIE